MPAEVLKLLVPSYLKRCNVGGSTSREFYVKIFHVLATVHLQGKGTGGTLPYLSIFEQNAWCKIPKRGKKAQQAGSGKARTLTKTFHYTVN